MHQGVTSFVNSVNDHFRIVYASQCRISHLSYLHDPFNFNLFLRDTNERMMHPSKLTERHIGW